jgi:hypothetical protein
VLTGAGKSTSFGFVCAKPGFPPEFKPIVAELMAKHKDDGVRAWGDRAVSVRLRHGAAASYFVPLACGATGNCTWAIVTGSPARSLGVGSAAVIMTKADSREWPSIFMFTTSGAGSGEIAALSFSGDSYRQTNVSKLGPAGLGILGDCLLDNESCCPK